ncbi:MAG: KilA-N domain-containing protein [Chitinophagaceae bacterium]|nr:KilA-N domain-containing protein [Chitinophagaceae bacterium]
MANNKKITIQQVDIVLYEDNKQDYISLTDMARYRDAERSDYILQNRMRNRSTIEFIGLWEQFHNPDFNSIEFDGIKNIAGSNSFSLTPKRWIEATNAVGIVSKTGRYGGTLAKVNYRIHTDAIKENLIPQAITKQQAAFVYANEADLLNVALFGKTAAEWRERYNKKIEIRPRNYKGILLIGMRNYRCRNLAGTG